MKNPFALSQNDTAKLENLARRYGIELVLLFGSRARGEAWPGSDLDAGVLFKPRSVPSPRTMYAMGVAMAGLFEDDADVVPLDSVNPELRCAAAREGKILYERTPGVFAGFIVENLSQSWST